MKNKMKGQQNIRRPLPIRIMALVMAVVMIFSVVYINNRNGVVKAEPDESGAVVADNSFITKTKLQNAGFNFTTPVSTATFTAYVPYNSDLNNVVEFTLPSYANEVITTDQRLVKFLPEKITEGDTAYESGYYTEIPTEITSAENIAKFSDVIVYGTKSYHWSNEAGVITSLRSGSTSSSAVLNCYSIYSVKTADDVYAAVNYIHGYEQGVTTIGTVSIQKEELCGITTGCSSFIVTAEEKEEEGKTKNESVRSTDPDHYYGAVSYEVSDDETVYTALSDLVNAYNGGTKADGNYTIKKSIKAGTVVLDKVEGIELIKDTMIINSIKATYNKDGGKETSYTSGLDSVSVTGINKKYPVNIVIYTDIEFGDGDNQPKAVYSSNNYGGVLPVVNGKNITITIPADALDHSPSGSFTVKIFQSKQEADIGTDDLASTTVSITTGNGTPSFTGESIGVAGEGTKTITVDSKTYVNSTAAEVKGTVSVPDTSGAFINGVSVYKKGESDYSTEPEASATVTGTSASEDVRIPITLAEGGNTYRLGATSTFEESANSAKELTLYCDTTAPTESSVSVSQTIGATTHSEDLSLSSNKYTATQKISKSRTDYEPVITIALADNTGGCGLPTGAGSSAVYCGETKLDKVSAGVYSYTIPASQADQTEFTFTLYDALGNHKDITVALLYFDETMTISNPTIFSGDNAVQFGLTTDNFVTWTEAQVGLISSKGYLLSYNVTSNEVPISSATIKSTSGGTTETIVIPSKNITQTKATAPYEYTIITPAFSGVTHTRSDIVFTATNANSVSDKNTTTVIKVDVTNPEVSNPPDKKTGTGDEATAATAVTVDGKEWYKKDLVLWFTCSDASDTDETTDDPASGLKDVKKNYAEGEVDGIESLTAITDGKFMATVKEATLDDSNNPVAALVNLKVIDNAGNETLYSGSFYVDGKAPTTGLDITGVSASAYKPTEPSLVNLNSAPSDIIISYSPDDTLSKIKENSTKATIKDSAGNERPIVTGEPLSYYFTAEGTKPALNQGDTVEYTITVETSDNVGNTKVDSVRIKVDGSKPTSSADITTAYTKGKNSVYNTNVSVALEARDANISQDGLVVFDNGVKQSVTFDISAADASGIKTATATYTASSEEPHTIRFEVTDDSGNTPDAGQKSVSFTIDKTKPDVTTLLNGSEYTKLESYNKTVTTGISYTDANKDDNDITATIIRKIPGGGEEKITKKGVGPFTLSADGIYSVIYDVKDKAGNLTTTDEIKFTVDNTAPVHNLYVTTANPSKVEDYPNNYINGVGKWQSSHEAYRYGQFYNGDVTVELNYFDYNLDWVYVTDNGDEISPSWTKNGAFGKATYTFTSEGYHDVQIWSKDLSGNETNDTVLGKRVRFTIDRSAPSITTYLNSSLYSEGSGTRYLNTNGSLNVSVSEGNKDTYDLTRTYKVTPPGGTSKTYEDKVDEGTENYSEEADYEVSYVAVDKAGNKSATRNVYFRVDRTAPKLTINGPGSSSNASSTSVSFNVQESFYWDMTSCTVKIYKKVDGSGEVLEKTLDMNPSSANYSQSYSFVDDAEYRMEFTAEDKCGNKSQTDYTFIKDGNAPSILLSGVKNYDKTDKNVELTITIEEAFYTSNRVTLSGTRTDIDGKSHKIDFDDFATNRTKISQLQQMFKEDGIYDITVTSTDKAGNSSSKTVHFTIDTTKPVIGDLSKYDGVKLNKFKWDVDLDELVKDLTVCDIKLYLDGALYDGTSDIEDGSHVLKVEATDELGHSSSKEVTFVLDSKAPNIIVMNVEEGDNLLESTDITVTVELDEDSLDTVTLNDKAINIANNEGKITVNEKGDYVLNATAHDEAGNVSSVEIKFSYGKQTNLLFIGIIAGAAILLLLLLLVFLRRRRNDN